MAKFFGGLSLAVADARYVNITGDTMTGALAITNGYLVVGNTTPSSIATGDYFSRGGMSLGNASTNPLSNSVLDVVDSRSLAASVTTWRGVRMIANVTAGTSGVNITGIEFIARDNTANAQNLGNIIGIDGRAQLQSTGNTVSNMIGISANIITPASSGTISNVYGIRAVATHSGVATNWYRSRLTKHGGSGTITNEYGLYIEDVNTGGTIASAITTNAGNIIFNEGGDANTDFRVEGDTDSNLFFTDASADKVGIGTNAPAEKLEIKTSGLTRVLINSGAGNFAVLRFAKADVSKYELGIRSTTDDFYIFETDANQYRMVILDGGNMGVGLTAPAQIFEIGSGTNTIHHSFSITSGQAVILNETGSNIDFRVEGDTVSNLLFVDASADFIGIGTSSPAVTLDIRSASTTTNPFISSANSDASHFLSFFGGNSTPNLPALFWVNNDDLRLGTGETNAGGSFVEKFRFQSNGNMGINTTAPDLIGAGSNYRTLTIMGGATTGTTGAGILELAAKTPDASDVEVGVIDFSHNSNTTSKRVAYIFVKTSGATATNRGGQMSFATKANAGSLVEAMVIDNTQRVGIGITPTAVLHLKAGTSTANTAPLKFTSGTNLTAVEAGVMEYDGRFTLTDTDAARRHIVQAVASTKTVAGAPYTNDGYVEAVINGTTVRLMTTAG